jgi:predicted DNA-binding WGR domain protein
MQNLLTITFEAHHAELNHHRRYEITVGRDLLDDWAVSIRYGRTGQWGREQRFAGTEASELKAIVRERLRRRLSASRRIGCAYRLKDFSTADGFDAEFWLPSEVMARFVAAPVGRHGA